jgi:type VI secretion system secreted protein VgrG
MRNVALHLASGDDLSVRHFAIVEALSSSFHIDLIARGRDDVDLHASVGHHASLRLATNRGSRIWTGVCANITQTHVEPDGLSTYSLRLAPKLWLLTHRRNHRVFQHLTAPEIAKKLLHDWKIEPKLKIRGRHPKLELRIQYGETDYDFLRRILVEAGITFYFDTKEDKTRLVISDAPQSNEPHREKAIPFHRDGSGDHDDHISDVSLSAKVHPTHATYRDFDFRRPHYAATADHAGEGPLGMLEQYYYAPGHSNVEHDEDGPGTPHADAHGRYRNQDKESKARAERKVEALRAHAAKIAFNTSLKELAPGTVFALSGHPHPEVAHGKHLLVTQSWINGEVEGEWTSGGHAVRADRPYRPLLTTHAGEMANCSNGGDPFEPVTKVKKPRIHGVQSAIVVGPEGEDIHTDEHGRVRVRFGWDRDEHHHKNACWLRVIQASAGAGSGSQHLPHVGQEVLVSFLDGDPDHPIIVGRLHNATAPMPYALPEHKSRSTWKGSAKDGGGNEITFDDKHDNELFYLQAQGDLHKLVKNDELEHTLGDRHITVDGDLVISARGKVIILSGDEVIAKGSPRVSLNPGKEHKKPSKPKELRSGKHHDKPKEKPKSKTSLAEMNERLFKLHPGSRPESDATAKARLALARKFKPLAIKLAKKYNLPPAFILAWMNRESALGEFLRPDGYSKFDGFGYGLLQVDRRYHKPTGDPFGEPSCDQAIGDVFEGMMKGVKKRHPGWTPEEQMAGALVDYNSGPGNATTRPSSAAGWKAMDGGTADDNYSRDVWAQSQWYSKHMDW